MSYKSETFRKLQQASDSIEETRDCAVKAIAVVGDLSYEDAHTLLELYGRKRNHGTKRYITREALKFLDLQTKDVTEQFRAAGAKTVRTLGRVIKNRKGTYLVFTANHILAVKDGEICDWTDGRLHRIQGVERVEPTMAANSEDKK